MRVLNNSTLNISHDKYTIKIGETLDVPNDVADIWLKIDGVTKYVTPEDLEAEKAKAVEEALKAERAKNAAKPASKKTKK